MRPLVVPVVEALFRLLFTYDSLGEEKLPAQGPALVAANHPSYLDPILLSLQVRRPIRFMAAEFLFKVPLLGSVIRAFGAFPVDTRPGHGREAFAKAKALIDAGEIVGIFPEGRRSLTGWMEPTLRAGTARLALETGAPLYPATIVGAHRAWPKGRALPQPARIHVRFHDPIDPVPYRALPEDDAIAALLAELRRRVDRSLLPGVKRDLRLNMLYRGPAPWPRLFESAPPLLLALLVFWKTRSLAAVLPAYLYVAYLLLDHFVIPQRRLTKWLRNVSAPAFLLGWAPTVLRATGLPEVPGGAALAALLAGAALPYFYERAGKARGFAVGLVAAILLEMGALRLAPEAVGPHLGLPLFAAAYAWERRAVFWPYAAPVLAVYAIAVPLWLGGGLALGLHALAGLVAWAAARVLPASRTTPSATRTEPLTGLGLGSPGR